MPHVHHMANARLTAQLCVMCWVSTHSVNVWTLGPLGSVRMTKVARLPLPLHLHDRHPYRKVLTVRVG